jgi:uncharacterized SAM-binding protein YcdF (DUF218 family)
MKDAIIVLAGGINPDGSLPDMPKERIDGALRHFHNKESSVLIMSGRYGFWLDWKKEIPTRTEAEAMKEYAVSLGVPTEAILLEEKSKDTLGNAYFTKVDILEPNNWKSVLIVTSDFHYERTRYIFDLVLGDGYDTEYEVTKTNVPFLKMEALKAQEVATIAILKTIIGNTQRGGTEAIASILSTKHPGYSKNPEYSYEKLKEMLGRG